MDDTKVVETIDLTPTWVQILPQWLFLYEQAILGKTKDNETIRKNAEIEFKRMAEAADRWNDHLRSQLEELER